jgi:hypothetical protein
MQAGGTLGPPRITYLEARMNSRRSGHQPIRPAGPMTYRRFASI